MVASKRPVRRATAVETVPSVSIVDGFVLVDTGDERLFMTPEIASGYVARISEKLAGPRQASEPITNQPPLPLAVRSRRRSFFPNQLHMQIDTSRPVLLAVECTALALCVVFGALWYAKPDGHYDVLFTLSTLTFVFTEMVRRYGKAKEPHVKVEIDTRNTFAARFDSAGSSLRGHFSLGFYSISVTNMSSSPLTIKDVLLRYRFRGVTHTELSHAVATGNCPSAADGKMTRAIIVNANGKNCVLMDWVNIRSKIAETQPISPGGALRGSALYVTCCRTAEEMRELQDAELVVSDYAGRTSIHPVAIEPVWIDRASNTSLSPRLFSFDQRGQVTWLA